MLSLRRVCACAVAFSALTVAPCAWAQAVALAQGQIDRTGGFRPDTQQPFWISRADCVSGDRFLFPLTLAGFEGYTLEVWAGGASSNCTEQQARSESGSCWLVASAAATSTVQTMDINVRAIVDQDTGANSTAVPGPEVCDSAGGSSAPQTVTLYFMLMTGTNEAVGQAAVFETKYDLVGPSSPTDVTAAPGDTILKLEWSAITDSDLLGYRFFCDPMPGQEPVSTADAGAMSVMQAAGMGGAAGSGDDAGTAGVGGDAGAAGTAGDGGLAGAGGTGGQAGDAGVDAEPEPTAACETENLIAGTVPDPARLCGEVSSETASSGIVRGLSNYQTYSVGVAAFDTVGNVGPLSNIVCSSPVEVDDFFELYRKAGGQAGGGFCSLNGPVGGAGTALAAFAVLAAVAAAAQWRRRR